MASVIQTVRRTPTHSVTVTAVTDLTPRMRRITLAGPTLRDLAVTPAQDIEVILPDGDGVSGRRVKRRYTIRTARPDVGELDVDALVHPHGPGGRWAGATAVGAELEFIGPRGHLELRPAAWHLFVGDEAALPAFTALIEALPAAEAAIVLAEVGDASDELDLGRADVTWLHRGTDSAGGSERLAAALASFTHPDGLGRAYLLGESRAMVALRPAIEAHGISPENSFVKGYWNLGRGARRIPLA